eukprot:797500_1
MNSVELLTDLICRFSRSPSVQCCIQDHNEQKATDYDVDDFARKYTQLQSDYNWFYSTLSGTMLKYLKQITSNKNSINIIDIACGNGKISNLIMENQLYLNKTAINIIGIDISKSQIDLAQTSNQYVNHIHYEVGNAENIQYKNRFDVAICFWCFNYSNNTHILKKK